MAIKAVIGVDGSRYSEWLLGWLRNMPFHSSPRVTAVHVLDIGSIRAPFLSHPVVRGSEPDEGEAMHHVEALARQVEMHTKQRMTELGLKGSVRVEKGHIAQALLRHAGKTGLIAVGSRGLDAVDRFVFGSVSTAITLHARSPVLVVKEPPQTIRRILFATDDSPSSTKALQFLTKQFKIKSVAEPLHILLVHVMPFLRYTVVKEAREKFLAQEAAKLEKAGYRVREFPCVGPPAEEIMKVVNYEQPDLIVTGAKGRSATARFLLGSVSTKLVHRSACSVLVVR